MWAHTKPSTIPKQRLTISHSNSGRRNANSTKTALAPRTRGVIRAPPRPEVYGGITSAELRQLNFCQFISAVRLDYATRTAKSPSAHVSL